jgi:D-glycero-alpha-D-manno-heptose-7-phosphate kinase
VAIEASAPVRICDNGGWTDTWFGGPGRVLNVAVTPGVEVDVCPLDGPGPVMINLASFGERYTIVPGAARTDRHPLVEAAVDTRPPPEGLAVEVTVRSSMPASSGTGTSAAVAVALVGALAAARGERLSRRDVAYAAHALEVDALGRESGIQDQVSAAYGGINYLEIEQYPEAIVKRMPPWEDLGHRLTLVYLGRGHDSSAVHRQVIAGVQRCGPALSRLRDAAVAARDAALARDLGAFGQAMIANTEAQRSLHPSLIGGDADRLIEVAKSNGAVGWKVNGAGGDGGSLSVLSPTPENRERLERQVARSFPAYQVLPVAISLAGLEIRGCFGT